MIAPSMTTTLEKRKQFVEIAQSLAREREGFFAIKGPGVGDRDTIDFMAELRRRAFSTFGTDHTERKICGANNLCIDFYFPEDATIVEIALGLRNPSSEFERDILKALMATEAGYDVGRLVFISKPGALKRLGQPGARAIALWAEKKHGSKVVVHELENPKGPQDSSEQQ